MNVALAIGIGAAVAVCILVAFSWWLAAWAREAASEARGQAERRLKVEAELAARDLVMGDLETELERERTSRRLATEAAQRATKRLAETGDAPALVDSINAELAGLSALSALRTAAAASGGGEEALHGPSPPLADPDPAPADER